MKTGFLLVLLIAVSVGGYFLYTTYKSNQPMIDIVTQAPLFCSGENVSLVEISRTAGYIKVTSALLGGGSTYYSEKNTMPVECPVVAPDSLSTACKDILTVTDWETVCENPIAPQITTPTNEEAELTGFTFILDVIAVAATTSPDAQAESRILNALSQNAQSKVSRETLSQDLAAFLGIQDVPDQGASVEDLQIISDTEAQLFVGLNFSGGRALRTVHLVVENDVWKVDKVTNSSSLITDFEEEGNLTMPEAGEPDTWTLVYEKPGQPALTKQLTFDTASICATGVENTTCNPTDFTVGQRVKILGQTVDEENVLVIRLENK